MLSIFHVIPRRLSRYFGQAFFVLIHWDFCFHILSVCAGSRSVLASSTVTLLGNGQEFSFLSVCYLQFDSEYSQITQFLQKYALCFVTDHFLFQVTKTRPALLQFTSCFKWQTRGSHCCSSLLVSSDKHAVRIRAVHFSFKVTNAVRIVAFHFLFQVINTRLALLQFSFKWQTRVLHCCISLLVISSKAPAELFSTSLILVPYWISGHNK